MVIDSCLEELRNSFSKEYDDYKPLLERCRALLFTEIENNPKNIHAVCLIAMVEFELRVETEIVLGYLEEAYTKYKDQISGEDFSMLATDMAYFYIEECENKEDESAALLQEAVKRGSTYPETYYALGLLHYENDRYKKACRCSKAPAGFPRILNTDMPMPCASLNVAMRMIQ